MEKRIKLIEDRKSNIKVANSLLPSLLNDDELNFITGGANNCKQVVCPTI